MTSRGASGASDTLGVRMDGLPKTNFDAPALRSGNNLEPGIFPVDTFGMDDLVGYRRDAMKLALVLGISDGQKQSINGLIEKLAAKQDINK